MESLTDRLEQPQGIRDGFKVRIECGRVIRQAEMSARQGQLPAELSGTITEQPGQRHAQVPIAGVLGTQRLPMIGTQRADPETVRPVPASDTG